MRFALLVTLVLASTTACALRLGGSSPETYRVLGVRADSSTSATVVAERIRAEGSQFALIAADRDSAWFADVATQAGLELSGPGTTGPHALAFLTSRPILGDTSIVLLVPSGGRIHMHDALFEIDENRNIDLMLIDLVGVNDLRDGVRTLLSYIATDVGNNVPLVIGVTATNPVVDDSVAVLLRAAFADARDCADVASAPPVAALRLLYGPAARLQCEQASALPDDTGVSARLVVGR